MGDKGYSSSLVRLGVCGLGLMVYAPAAFIVIGLVTWLQNELMDGKKKMNDLINIALKAIFMENMLLALFLGMCSFLACSKMLKQRLVWISCNICDVNHHSSELGN